MKIIILIPLSVKSDDALKSDHVLDWNQLLRT